MHSKFITILLFILFAGNHLFAQIRPAYLELRQVPADSLLFQNINSFIQQGKKDSLLLFTQKASSELIQKGNMNDYLFLMNQVGANLIVIFQDIQTADSLFHTAEQLAIDRKDTLQIEYAVLMKYLAVNYFYRYEDQLSLIYFRRGLKVLQAMQIENPLTCDFKVNIGNAYLNLGNNMQAVNYLEPALYETAKYKLGQLYMLVGEAFAHIAFTADTELGIDLLKKVETDALELDFDTISKNKFLATIYHNLAGYYSEIGNREKKYENDQLAYEYINRTSIPDLYMRLKIYETRIQAGIEQKDTSHAQLAIEKTFEAFRKFKINDPELIAPVYTKIAYYYHYLDERDSMLMYVQKCDSLLPVLSDNSRLHYFSMRGQIADSAEEVLEYTGKALSVLLEGNDLFSDSVLNFIVKRFTSYEFLTHLMPNLEMYADATLELNPFQSQVDSSNGIKIYYLISQAIQEFGNGIIEKQTGLVFSENLERITSKLLRNIYLQESSEVNSEENRQVLKQLASSQTFFMQKQIGFKKHNRSSNSDSLWNSYFDLLIQKRQKELAFQSLALKDTTASEYAFADSTFNLSVALLKKRLQLQDQKALYIPDIESVDIQLIQAKLKDNEAIINYFLSEQTGLCAFVVKNEGLTFYHLAAMPGINDLITQFSRTLRSGGNMLNEQNRELSRLVLSALEKDLHGIEHLIIIPHSDLWKIPFEVLLCGNEEFLVEKYSITYQTSLNLWYRSAQVQRPDYWKVLAMAPGFGGNKNSMAYRQAKEEVFAKLYSEDRSKLSALPFSVKEIQLISQIVQDAGSHASVLINTKASETNFKKFASGSDIIHVATHGFVSKSYPELNGIFFSTDPMGRDDAYLFADEIPDLNFDTKLMVLSSCNSGSGIIEGSEGINSLQRYFLLAGIPNVMASVWKIHDEKTKELMSLFYKHLMEGNDYGMALRLAKNDCIKKGFVPLDWAGFLLFGQ